MDSPQLFLAFGAVMLIAALLGVAIDWFGKPLRHRRFVPKAYRFPDEREPRHSKVRATEWSEANFVLPVIDTTPAVAPQRYPQSGPPDALIPAGTQNAVRDLGPPTAQVPVIHAADEFDESPGLTPGIITLEDTNPEDPNLVGVIPGIVTLEDTDPHDPDLVDPDDPATAGSSIVTVEETRSDDPDLVGADAGAAPGVDATATGPGEDEDEDEDERVRGWQPGQYVFNLTPDGREPSATTVRNRYWKNVAVTGGAGIFGDANLERMAAGKPPQRLNHHTGRIEPMRLPAATRTDNRGKTPVPEWSTPEIDPFA